MTNGNTTFLQGIHLKIIITANPLPVCINTPFRYICHHITEWIYVISNSTIYAATKTVPDDRHPYTIFRDSVITAIFLLHLPVS